MTHMQSHRFRLLLSALAVGAALAGQTVSAASLDLGPRSRPTPALTCSPVVGGEVNTLCAPRPNCGCGPALSCNPYSNYPSPCRIDD
jgi:hypothetical protein